MSTEYYSTLKQKAAILSSDHGIYAQKLTSDSQLMHFSCTAKYGAQHRITVVMRYRKVISAAISTMKPDCLSRRSHH